MKPFSSFPAVLLSFGLLLAGRATAAPLELKPGDHIALVGNSLPDRMQHHGWLETLIYAKFPKHELVFRNLSAAGDEVATWHRSENFGSRDEWLTKTKADVVFAFYGFNESFGGDAGLDKFKQDLGKFIKDTRAQNYSGKGAPRVVLFSPIANEKLPDPNLADPAANNANLQKYTTAMAEVAKANDVPFVDLFAASQALYAAAAKRTRMDEFKHYAGNTIGPVAFQGAVVHRNKLDFGFHHFGIIGQIEVKTVACQFQHSGFHF